MKKTEKARRGRRDFTKTLAAALVAAPASLSSAGAQTTPAPEAKAPPNPQPTPTPQQQPQQQPPSPVAVAYAAVAEARFGSLLTPEEMARVRRDLEGNVRAADRLRASRLANADEPDFVFEA
jgi:hypothetical protein